MGVENVTNIKPFAFWQRFVSQRQPVVLEHPPDDLEWKVSNQTWTDAYLTAAAGGEEVVVEKRVPGGGFGRGCKVTMTLARFLQKAAAGDESLYLSTQPVDISAVDGHPKLLGSLLHKLQGDFPLRPALVGQLVPQQINIWMGHSSQGASSGLHHDFHDNLYILIRGCKRFELYHPQHAERMYTHGRVQKVHRNGRIVYEGQMSLHGQDMTVPAAASDHDLSAACILQRHGQAAGNILANGCEASEVARWHAECKLAAAEREAAAGVPGAAARLEDAEQELDALMHASLMDSRTDELRHDLYDDYVDSDADETDSGGPSEGHNGADLRHNAASTSGTELGGSNPSNFSTVDLTLPASALTRRFPRFPGRNKALTCELQAGQMLYLPAGWFHCVTSQSCPDGGSHLAFNYWFHPPDNLDPGPAGFAAPYTEDCYWPAQWVERFGAPSVQGQSADASRNDCDEADDAECQGLADFTPTSADCLSAASLVTRSEGPHCQVIQSRLRRSRKARKRTKPKLLGWGRQHHLQAFARNL